MDARFGLGDGNLTVDIGAEGFQRGIVEGHQTFADILLRFIIGLQQDDRPAFQAFNLNVPFKGHGHQGIIDLLRGQLHHLRCPLTKELLGKVGVSLVDAVPEGVTDPTFDSVRIILWNPHFFCYGIRFPESDAEYVIHQLIRIGFHRVDGIRTINLVELHGIGCRNSVLLKK